MTLTDTQAEFVCYGLGVTLTGRAGSREVLGGIDLEIATGSVTTIVGRSGSGKTTLLRVLAGLTPTTEGSLVHRGVPVLGPVPDVVTVFQDYSNALLPWRDVRRNVALGLERSRLRRDERRRRVDEALAVVGLERFADEYPWRLSGGMQQRVQIARALAVRPTVLLMDEPFGALDSMTKALLQDQLLEVRDATGCTIVFITHDVEEAVYLGDRVLILDGRPGSVTAAIDVNLPAPRDQVTTREASQYLEIRHELYHALRSGNDG